MCLFKGPDMETPQMPVQYAAQKTPTRQDAQGAGNRMRDRLRGATSTLLTGPGGTGAVDTAGKKTLLGA